MTASTIWYGVITFALMAVGAVIDHWILWIALVGIAGTAGMVTGGYQEHLRKTS